MQQLNLNALNPALGYGDSQWTAFASDLGLEPGVFPEVIDLFSPKSGRTLRFERTGTSRPERVYYRVAADEPSRFHRLSIIIFND